MRKNDDEDEVDLLLEGILDVVPDLPITQEKLDIFLTTLKSLVPEIEIASSIDDYKEDDNISKSKDFYKEKIDGENLDELIEEEEAEQEKQKVKLEKVAVTYQSAIILTKRPSVTAGVLHELTQIAEKPSGVYRETALSIINEEYAQSKEKSVPLKDMNKVTDFYPITPLSLSDSQLQVVKILITANSLQCKDLPEQASHRLSLTLWLTLSQTGKQCLLPQEWIKPLTLSQNV